MGLTMSAAQLENLVRNNVDRLEDDRELNEWLPGVATDVSSVDVGLWRCPSGEIACDEGCCGDCDCCDNAGLWESPRSTGSPSVEPVGIRRFSWR
jgi:hypothetical protein